MEVENLIAIQSQIGEEIQILLRNIKKDSSKRKEKASYFEDRKRLIEEHWKKFDQGNNSILELLKGTPHPHVYFEKQYYNQMQTIVHQAIEEFNAKILQLPATETASEEVDHIQKLIRHQAAVLESMSRTMKHISPENKFTYKSIIDNLWKQIESLHFEIHKLCITPEEVGYSMERFISAEEAMLQFCHPYAEPVSVATNQAISTISSIQLPKVSIPKFDGSYLKWQQFHDIFNKMVHESAIPKIQKMWYLKANLSGEAERLVRHLELTEVNYDTAWTMLKERFNNKRVLSTAIFEKLFDHPNVTNDSQSIKNLHDNVNESLQALKNIGIKTDTWDPVLLFHMTRKLDRLTHTLYEQTILDTREIQTTKEFLGLLEQRFLALEAIGGKMHKEKQKTSASATTSSLACLFCQKGHSIYKCEKFKESTPAERLTWVQRKRLCVNCLKAAHMTKQCMSKYTCIKCNKNTTHCYI